MITVPDLTNDYDLIILLFFLLRERVVPRCPPFFSSNSFIHISQFFKSLISEVKLAHLDDDTERYVRSRIKTLNYATYTQLVRMVKILRCRRPDALA